MSELDFSGPHGTFIVRGGDPRVPQLRHKRCFVCNEPATHIEEARVGYTTDHEGRQSVPPDSPSAVLLLRPTHGHRVKHWDGCPANRWHSWRNRRYCTECGVWMSPNIPTVRLFDELGWGKSEARVVSPTGPRDQNTEVLMSADDTRGVCESPNPGLN